MRWAETQLPPPLRPHPPAHLATRCCSGREEKGDEEALI